MKRLLCAVLGHDMGEQLRVNHREVCLRCGRFLRRAGDGPRS